MKVELTLDAAGWVQGEIDAGRFSTAEEAVRHAITQTKLIELRAKLDAAVAEGGSHTTQDVRRYVREQLDKRNQPAGLV